MAVLFCAVVLMCRPVASAAAALTMLECPTQKVPLHVLL